MAAKVDRLLSGLQSRGVRRGVLGASRGWLWVAVASWGIRRIRRANQPEVLYRTKLRPGETLEVGHLTEVHEPPRRKRRKHR